MKKNYIQGNIKAASIDIPQVKSQLDWQDRLGTVMVRLAMGRNHYTVNPGLYAVGNPDRSSLIFVSANYKLSFDCLRQGLSGIDAWIMVVDTKGINVWCAAGKGTFGTQEIVDRIELTGLKKIVGRRDLIVPQLCAPGVAAYKVKKLSGFTVIYGPVRSSDIKEFLKLEMNTNPEMRRVKFDLYDRLKVIPTEVMLGLKYLLIIVGMVFLFHVTQAKDFSLSLAMTNAFHPMINLILAYLGGVLIGPILLPWLPSRSFSVKGASAGIIMFLFARHLGLIGVGWINISAWLFLFIAIASFGMMNFTGASTYTCISGVRKEVALSVPVQIIILIVGISLLIVSRCL
jgi:acetyl-CoA decarbonylase/synthase complex subunit gamma